MKTRSRRGADLAKQMLRPQSSREAMECTSEPRRFGFQRVERIGVIRSNTVSQAMQILVEFICHRVAHPRSRHLVKITAVEDVVSGRVCRTRELVAA